MSPTFPVLCSLPQGFPVFPILFLLYIEPFLQLSKGRFGYADDGYILVGGNTLEACNQSLQEALDLILKWGKDNAVSFEIGKTEL